jgi:protein-disulfide isomerase
MMKVEMFHTPGCPACVAAHAELRAAAQQAVKDLEWREVNVVDNLDRAVELGVLTLPSIVIDGELVFTSMPTAAELREALVVRNREPA